jgi:hypothetical protein
MTECPTWKKLIEEVQNSPEAMIELQDLLVELLNQAATRGVVVRS